MKTGSESLTHHRSRGRRNPARCPSARPCHCGGSVGGLGTGLRNEWAPVSKSKSRRSSWRRSERGWYDEGKLSVGGIEGLAQCRGGSFHIDRGAAGRPAASECAIANQLSDRAGHKGGAGGLDVCAGTPSGHQCLDWSAASPDPLAASGDRCSDLRAGHCSEGDL